MYHLHTNATYKYLRLPFFDVTK